MRYLTLFFILPIIFFCPSSVSATLNGPYNAKVQRVIDGDTFEARVQIWLDHYAEYKIRLRGIDAPELRASCDAEKRQAIQAKNFLEKILQDTYVTLTNIERGKYGGRIIADVWVGQEDISQFMIENRAARSYSGNARDSWC